MTNRSLLLLAILLVGLAAYTVRVPAAAVPLGDEASYALISASLWHEHDLSFDHRDLLRAYRTWNEGPAGLTLFTDDGGHSMHFGRPLAYPLAALPFYALFGFRGLALLNAVLFGLLIAGFVRLRGRECPCAVPLILGSFFVSAAFSYVFRLVPEVFLMACTGFPLLLWWRQRARNDQGQPPSRRDLLLLAGSGALLGAAALQEPLTLLLALPIVADLLLARRLRQAGVIVVGALLACAALAAVQRKGTGEWTAWGGAQRRTFAGEFPVESGRDLWAGFRGTEGSPEGEGAKSGSDRVLAHLPRNLGYLVAGRQIGLLAYYPISLFLLLLAFRRTRERPRLLLLGGVVLYLVAALVWRSGALALGAGGEGFGLLGLRTLAVLVPAFLLLPSRMNLGNFLVIPFVPAALWTVGALAAVLSPVAARVEPGAQLLEAPFLRLPLETTLLTRAGIPGYAVQSWQGSAWLVPVENFFVEEQNGAGVWLRGASRSELFVVSPQPLRRLAFYASSLSDANVLRVSGGAERVIVRFDTEGKRQGTPVDLGVEPVARDIGFFAPGTPDYVYRLRIESADGAIPARRHWHNRDPRYLGTFLDFNAQVR